MLSLPLDRDALWVAEINQIPAEIRVLEPQLYQSRWFDYWTLTPIEATCVFANQYIESYREAYARMYDYEKAQQINPLHGTHLLALGDLVALTRARQEADRLGCKYDFFINFLFERAFNQFWRHMPRPNQCYSEEALLDVADAWAERKRLTLQLASPVCATENHPAMGAYHNYLIEQVKNREMQHLILARLVYKEALLPEEVARQHFPDSIIERAFSHFNK